MFFSLKMYLLSAFFNEAHLRCMKNEAGLTPCEACCGTQKGTGALRFMRALLVLHGGNAAASLTSEASDFIIKGYIVSFIWLSYKNLL